MSKWHPLALTEDSRYQKKGLAVYHATWAIAAIYGTTWWEWSARILYNKDHGLKVVNYRNHFLLGLGQNRNAKIFRADTETTQNQQIQAFLSRYNTWPRILYNKDHGLKVVNDRNHFLGLVQKRNVKILRLIRVGPKLHKTSKLKFKKSKLESNFINS